MRCQATVTPAVRRGEHVERCNALPKVTDDDDTMYDGQRERDLSRRRLVCLSSAGMPAQLLSRSAFVPSRDGGRTSAGKPDEGMPLLVKLFSHAACVGTSKPARIMETSAPQKHWRNPGGGGIITFRHWSMMTGTVCGK